MVSDDIADHFLATCFFLASGSAGGSHGI
jgi:hypothetical protein